MPNRRDQFFLFSVRLLCTMGVGMVVPVLPDIAASFSVSITAIGLVLVGYTLAGAVMTPIAGVLSDHYGRKAVLVPALVLFALGGGLAAFARTWEELLLCRVVQGLGAGPMGVLYNILAADMCDEAYLPRIMSRLTAVGSLGSIVFCGLGGILGEWSWRLPFLSMATALAVAMAALFVPLRAPAAKQAWLPYFRELRGLVADTKMWGFFLLFFLSYCMIFGPINTCFPLLAREKFHVSSSIIGAALTVVAAGSWLGATVLPFLHRRFACSSRALLCWGAAGYLVSLPLLPLMPSLVLCGVPLFINGVAQGLTLPLINAGVVASAPARDRAAIVAAAQTFMRYSISASPVLFTFAWATWGMENSYLLGAIVAPMLALAAIKTFPRAAGAR